MSSGSGGNIKAGKELITDHGGIVGIEIHADNGATLLFLKISVDLYPGKGLNSLFELLH